MACPVCQMEACEYPGHGPAVDSALLDERRQRPATRPASDRDAIERAVGALRAQSFHWRGLSLTAGPTLQVALIRSALRAERAALACEETLADLGGR